MVLDLQQIKNRYTSFIQIILFDKNGHLLSTCSSIFSFSETNSIFDQIYILESLKENIFNSKEAIELKMVEFEFDNKRGFYDFIIEKIEENVFSLCIVDQTPVYNYMQNVQTQKNLSIIKNEQLQRLNKKIKDQNKQIKLYSSFITHDIKEPITSIKGISDILLNSTLEHDEIKEASAYIKKSSDAALRLIDDVYNYAKLELDIVHYNIFNLKDFFDQIWDRLFYNSACKLINLIDQNVNIESDARILEQISNNLISNAIKHNDKNEGAHIKVGISYSKSSNIISISDNGPGIPENKKEEIFQPFYMLKKPRKKLGTGIGLSIVKRGVKKLNGKIKVESVLSEGTTFKLFLPKKP